MKINFSLLFLLLFTSSLFSQLHNDDKLRDLLSQHKNINHDSTLVYAKKLQLSSNKEYVIEGISNEAYAYYRMKDYETAERLALKLIEVCNKEIHTGKQIYYSGKISAYNRLFWIKKNQEDYKKAYEFLTLMQQTNGKNPNKLIKYQSNKITIKIARATIKEALKMEAKAKEILLSAYKDVVSDVFKEFSNDNYFLQQKANVLNGLGNVYMTLKFKENNPTYLDSADYYFDKSYEVTKHFKPLHNDSEIIYNFRKTEVLMARKEYQKAIDLINNYKNINNGYKYHHREYFQKAICFHHLKDSKSAILYANKLLEGIKKCETSKLVTIYDILSKEYNNLNKLDSAYKYSKLTLEQYNLARNNKDKTFNLFYNNNFNKAQQLNESIKKRESAKQRNLIISFIILFLALIAITLFLLKKEKKKKKALIFKMNQSKPIETEKKEYNIDEELENKILNEFKNTASNLDFLKTEFSINYIAQKLNTNTTYVSFVFNKHYSESFKQYCTRLKIDYIVEKLKKDKTLRRYSVQALAEEIGYTNASAFTRAFKKHVGITPSAYLKSLDN